MVDIAIKILLNDGTEAIFGKQQIKDISTLSQKTTDNTRPSYGIVPSSGTATIIDINGEIANFIRNRLLDNTNVQLGIYVNGKLMHKHIVSDSSYSQNDNILKLQFTDVLDSWRNIIYLGHDLNASSAYELLQDVLSYTGVQTTSWLRYDCNGSESITSHYIIYNDTWYWITGLTNVRDYEYLLFDIKNLTGKASVNGVYTDFTLRTGITALNPERLQPVYRYIESAEVDDMLDGVIYINDTSYPILQYLKTIKIQYPLIDETTVAQAINMLCELTQLQCFQNNNGEIKFVSGRLKIDTSQSQALYIPYNNQYSKLDYDLFIKNKYDHIKLVSNVFTISDAPEEVLSYSITAYDDNGNFVGTDTSTYNKGFKYGQLTTPSGSGADTVSVATNKPLLNALSNVCPDVIMPDFSAKVTKTYTGGTSETYQILKTGGTVTPTNEFANLQIDSNQIANANFNIQVGYPQSGLVSHQNAKNFSISFFKNTYSIETSDLDVGETQSNNVLEIGNRLFEEHTTFNGNSISTIIANNIIEEYKDGAHSGKITISCSDYFDMDGAKKIVWDNGGVFRLGDFIILEGNDLLWEITGITFRYNGVPFVDLELVEIENLVPTSYALTQFENPTDRWTEFWYLIFDVSYGIPPTTYSALLKEKVLYIWGKGLNWTSKGAPVDGYFYAIMRLNEDISTEAITQDYILDSFGDESKITFLSNGFIGPTSSYDPNYYLENKSTMYVINGKYYSINDIYAHTRSISATNVSPRILQFSVLTFDNGILNMIYNKEESIASDRISGQYIDGKTVWAYVLDKFRV